VEELKPYSKKDLLVGCITKYTKSDIEPWVESIQRSGYTGGKMMLVYDVSQDVINYLKLNHFDVYQSQLNQHIILQRFLDLHHLLKDIDCDRIIWTDVKDVIFQTNPSHWLNKNKTKPIIACSECITFKDDEWAVTNAGTSFPMEWEWLQNKTSHCAGTIAGDKEYIRDLFINIYRWSLTSSNPDQLSDQAAYNVLINQTQYKDIVQFTPQEDGFATQLGTVLIKKDHFGDKLLEPTPIVDDLIRNQKGEPFVIVHQYDRNPQLKQSIHNMYKDKIYTEPSKDNALGFSYENWLSIRSKGKYDTQYNDLLKDKRVIIVGPSPSLVGSGKGKEIDDYDIVIRINKGFPIEEGMESDLGSRTDIHYHCLHTHPACGGKIFYEEMKDKNVLVSCPYPKYVGPFHGDVTSFESENKKWNLPFHCTDTDYYIGVAKMLGTRPNAGTMTIMDLLCYDLKELHITGFTWFRDGWRKTYKDHCELFGEEEGKRKREKELSGEFGGNHLQKPQEDLVREIYLNDDRVFIDDIMKQILEVK
jgi:hypothetical protein